jgi:hypothetical protein
MGLLFDQFPLSLGCEFVVPRAAVGFRNLPFGFEPASLFEAMQRGVERPVLHLQRVLRARANSLADSVAMLWPSLEHLENEQVQRTLQEFDVICHEFTIADCLP